MLPDHEPAAPAVAWTRGLGLATALLLVVGLITAVVMAGDDDGDIGVATGGGSTTSTTDRVTTTTLAEPTTVAPETTAAPTTAAPTTAAPTTAATPTTAPAPSTTAGPSRTFTISPTSGPPGTRATATGTGCRSDGQDTGVALEFVDPSGQPVNGDGTSAQPDGTWQLEFSYSGNGPPGRWTVRAVCSVTNGGELFRYPDRTFTIT